MADELSGAGSAPSATPDAPAPTVSAERAASDAGDFASFDRAHVAKREGKALPDVPKPASAPRAEAEGETSSTGTDTPERQVSKRQQAINEYERRIAGQEQRIRDLESRMARPGPADPSAGQSVAGPSTQGPAAPKPESQKERVARYLALPDAPNIDEFETYPQYNAAQTLFLQDKLRGEEAEVRGREQAQAQRHQALVARDESFRDRLTTAKTADPDFVPSLSEEAKSLGGIDHALRSGVAPGPVHIIGELVYDSPHAVAFLKHISANPDALRALVTPPPQLARVPPQWRAKAHIDHLVTEFRRLEGRLAYAASLEAPDRAAASPSMNPVSSAPPPPPTLGKAGRSTDPVRSALARNDFEAFDAAEMEKRRRQRSGGRAG